MRVVSRVNRQSAVRGEQRAARSVIGLALVCATAAAVLTGCSMNEAICGGGEYPVISVGGTGGACVPNGEEPPGGYTRYPEGKVPEHVDDEWDTYWRTHTVDKDGNIAEVPEGR
ncbi:SCO0607 family lipoprotein [Streptomyces sp. NPDC057148]|uniref:SCO0607 family lipoprotein n=1 Tax=unclassified Streptomyces TaxID=2593676 RepID=UPI00363C7AD7